MSLARGSQTSLTMIVILNGSKRANVSRFKRIQVVRAAFVEAAA